MPTIHACPYRHTHINKHIKNKSEHDRRQEFGHYLKIKVRKYSSKRWLLSEQFIKFLFLTKHGKIQYITLSKHQLPFCTNCGKKPYDDTHTSQTFTCANCHNITSTCTLCDKHMSIIRFQTTHYSNTWAKPMRPSAQTQSTCINSISMSFL